MSDVNDSVNQTDDATGVTSGNDSDSQSGNQDTVKYDTYRKVLSEKKKRDEEVRELRERVEALQGADANRQETELKEQNKWKEIAELREQEVAKLKGEVTSMSVQQQNAVKLDAFLTAINARVDKEYWGLIDLESIKINPDSGEVDDMSVNSATEAFRKKYHRVVQTSNPAALPSNAPSGTAAATRGDTDFMKRPAAERGKILAAELIKFHAAK